MLSHAARATQSNREGSARTKLLVGPSRVRFRQIGAGQRRALGKPRPIGTHGGASGDFDENSPISAAEPN
jgi:hypothetical protein